MVSFTPPSNPSSSPPEGTISTQTFTPLQTAETQTHTSLPAQQQNSTGSQTEAATQAKDASTQSTATEGLHTTQTARAQILLLLLSSLQTPSAQATSLPAAAPMPLESHPIQDLLGQGHRELEYVMGLNLNQRRQLLTVRLSEVSKQVAYHAAVCSRCAFIKCALQQQLTSATFAVHPQLGNHDPDTSHTRSPQAPPLLPRTLLPSFRSRDLVSLQRWVWPRTGRLQSQHAEIASARASLVSDDLSGNLEDSWEQAEDTSTSRDATPSPRDVHAASPAHLITLCDEILSDDQLLGSFLTEARTLARPWQGWQATDSPRPCRQHIGHQTGPAELAAMEAKLLQQAGMGAAGAAEHEAEAALAGALAAADRLAQLSVDDDPQQPDDPLPPAAATATADSNSNPDMTAPVRQRLARLAFVKQQGLAAGAQALCGILSAYLWDALSAATVTGATAMSATVTGATAMSATVTGAPQGLAGGLPSPPCTFPTGRQDVTRTGSWTGTRAPDSTPETFREDCIQGHSRATSARAAPASSPARAAVPWPRSWSASPGSPAGLCQTPERSPRITHMAEVCHSQECVLSRLALSNQLMEATQKLGKMEAQLSEERAILASERSRWQSSTERYNAQHQAMQQKLDALEGELRWVRAEPSALLNADVAELDALVATLECALGRARTAHTQAVARQDQACPVCWEGNKGMVFQCGHQTCASCGEKLQSCPICRSSIQIRIRTY